MVSSCPGRDEYRSLQRASVIFIKMMRIYLSERSFPLMAARKLSVAYENTPKSTAISSPPWCHACARRMMRWQQQAS